MNILLIEDNPDHADIIMEVLQEAYKGQARIDWHTHFHTGLEKLSEFRYDICLCDLTLPDSRFDETTEKLRTIRTATPIVVLTSLEDEKIAADLINQGVQDYFSKDELDPKLLYRICSYAIERKKYTALLEKKTIDQDLFCQSLTHDFKAPIRRIGVTTQFLKNDLETNYELGETEKRHFKVISDNINAINQLVSTLFKYLNLDADNASFNPIDLQKVAMEAQSLVAQDTDSDATVNISRLPTLQANHPQMLLLFTNLISNSIKYNLNKPVINVSSHTDEKNNYCIIKIQDNGIGIEKRYYDKIFEPFQRLHGNNEFPGTGLGLSMVKRIVENHRGEIGIDSQLGVGTTFSVRLPYF